MRSTIYGRPISTNERTKTGFPLAHVGVSLTVAVLAFAGTVRAQTPLTSAFTYQGQLKQAGAAANGAYPMSFTLWDAATDGTQIGPTLTFEDIPGISAPVEVFDGQFNVSLDFGGDAFNGDARWLEITVEGTTLAPRQALTAAPYAVQTRGIHVNETGDKVGIGTTAPTHPLHVVSPDRTAALVESSNTAGTWLNLLNTSLGGRFWKLISTGEANGEGSGHLLIGHSTSAGSTSTVMTMLNNGRVGVGTTAPKQCLHNVGDYYGRGHVWLHAFEGDGQSGTAFLQARDDSGASSIGMQLRTQEDGVLRTAVNIAASGSVNIGGGLTLSAGLGGLDQSQELWNFGANFSPVWQSFTASQPGGKLVSVEYLGSSNDPAGSRGAQLTVYEGTGTGGTVVATQSYELPPATTHDYASITLDNPPTLIGGQVYTLHFQKTAPGVSHFVGFSDQDPYPGGMQSVPANSDLAFRTYVNSYSLRIASGAIRFPDNSYQTTGVRAVRATSTVDFGSFGTGNAVGQVLVPGAQLGGSVSMSPDQDLPNGLVLAWSRVSVAGVVRFALRNVSSSAIDPPPITFNTMVINP